jgi:hypothetical protein
LKYTPHQHHDRSSLQTALTDLENVAHKLNESKRLTEQKLHAKKLMKELNIKGFKADKLLRKDDLDQFCVSRCKLKTFFLSHLAINILRRVPPVEQELPTLSKHQSSSQVFSGVRVNQSLVIPSANKVWGGILESPCLSVRPCTL